MLNEEICKKREELNNSITNNKDYSVIYKLSVELDELIADYYKRKKLPSLQKRKKSFNNGNYKMESGVLA